MATCGTIPLAFLEALAQCLYTDSEGQIRVNVSVLNTSDLTPVIDCENSHNNPDVLLAPSIAEDANGNIALMLSLPHSLSNFTIREIIVSDTQEESDEVIVCDGAGITVTLLEATGSGKWAYIKNINASDVTVEGDDADTIDGELNQTVSQWDCLYIVDYEPGKWIII